MSTTECWIKQCCRLQADIPEGPSLASQVDAGWDPAFEDLTSRFANKVSVSLVSCDETALVSATAYKQLIQHLDFWFAMMGVTWWTSLFTDDCYAGNMSAGNADETVEQTTMLKGLTPESAFLAMLCLVLA